eukprot:g4887.t1
MGKKEEVLTTKKTTFGSQKPIEDVVKTKADDEISSKDKRVPGHETKALIVKFAKRKEEEEKKMEKRVVAEELKNIRSDLLRAVTQANAYRDEIEELKSKNKIFRSETEARIESGMNEERAAMKETVRQLQLDLCRRTKELDDCKVECSKLSSANQNLSVEILNLKNREKQFISKKVNLSLEKDKSKTPLGKNRYQREHVQQRSDSPASMLSMTVAKAKDATVNALTAQVDDLHCKMNSLREVVNDLHRENEEQAVELVDVTQKYNSLKDDTNGWKAEVASAMEAVHTAEGESAVHEHEVTTLKEKLRLAKSENQKLQEDATRIFTVLEGNTTVSLTLSEHVGMAEKLRNEIFEGRKARDQLQLINEEVDHLKKQLLEKNDYIKQLEAAVAKASTTMKRFMNRSSGASKLNELYSTPKSKLVHQYERYSPQRNLYSTRYLSHSSPAARGGYKSSVAQAYLEKYGTATSSSMYRSSSSSYISKETVETPKIVRIPEFSQVEK